MQCVCVYLHVCMPALRYGSEGDAFRSKMLHEQLPPYDLEPDACNGLNAADLPVFMMFTERKIEKSAELGRVMATPKAVKCFRCGGRIESGQLACTMDRITKQNGMRAYWHADTCFTCEVCEEMLVDLICFKFQTNRMLCSRHWSDQHKPRCAACDETIHAKDFTVAEGQNWHVEHFCCEKCDV